jgi:hypothetical protein
MKRVNYYDSDGEKKSGKIRRVSSTVHSQSMESPPAPKTPPQTHLTPTATIPNKRKKEIQR